MNRDRRDESNLERSQDLQHNEEAFKLSQGEKRLLVARQNTSFIWIVNSIFGLAGMLEILLGLRFFLRLFGANSQNGFAQIINDLSAPFVAPFSTLFISPTSNSGVNIFDVNIVIAIAAYALLSYLAASLVRFIFWHQV